jgi:hypothetical protein
MQENLTRENKYVPVNKAKKGRKTKLGNTGGKRKRVERASKSDKLRGTVPYRF